MGFADGKNPAEPIDPNALLLKKIDAVPTHMVRAYLEQRERAEFSSHLSEVQSAPISVEVDIRDIIGVPAHRIGLFVDPEYTVTLPKEKLLPELKALWKTGFDVLKEQGLVLHNETPCIHNPKNPKEDNYLAGIHMRYDIDLERSLPDKVKEEVGNKQWKVRQWAALDDAQMSAKVQELLAELNMPQVTDRIEHSDRFDHPRILIQAIMDKAVNEVVMPKIAEVEQFLQTEITKAKTQNPPLPPL